MPNKKLLLLIILGVAGVASLIYGILTPSSIRREIARSQDRGVASQGPAPTAPPTETSPPNLVLETRGPKPSGESAWGRNPFLPRKSGQDSAGGLTLGGVAWDEKSPKAIINDQIVGIGDEVAGNKVVDIKQDRVLLSDGVNDFELKLAKEE
jgi:hypothetical protein